MKYISDYINEPTKILLEQTGSFFAFTDSQFKEKAKDGVEYISLFAGLICPVDKAQEVREGLDKIYDEAVKQDVAENGKEAIIRRELSNHECLYTYDISDVVDKLKNYNYTEGDVQQVFNKMIQEVDND